MINKDLYHYLNLLRWLGALAVFSGHLRSFLFINYHDVSIEYKNIFIKIFYFLTGFGHQGVIVFFVISGFLVGGKVVSDYKNSLITNSYLRIYLIKRFSRIYIVLIPAIVLGLMFDYFGEQIDPDLYTNKFNISSMNYDAYSRLDGGIFLGNLFLIQTIFFDTLGTNAPLWSLSYEWWYYIIFVLMFINRYTFILAIFFLGIIYAQNSDIILYFSLWILGIFAYIIPKIKFPFLFSVFMLIVTLIYSRFQLNFFIDFIIAFFIFLSILSLKSKDSIISKNSEKIFILNTKIAEFTYSLYLLHFPAMVFVIAIIKSMGISILLQNPSIENFILYLGILVLIYLYTYLIFLLFENKTNDLRDFLFKRLLRNSE